MSLPRYTFYKDSDIPWVGAVPAHWSVQPLLGVASERNESNLGMRDDNLLSLSYGRIVRKDIASNDGLLPESFETYQVIYPGDIVLRLTDLQNDKRSLRSAQVQERGIITSAYLALEPKRIDSAFLAHLLRAYDLTKVFYSMGGGLRQSMKFADLKRMPIAIPPEPEQTAIAAFLDHETAKIDTLIAEQEKLLTLLAEKRQATISHAVTKGLNPDVPMKDSGVEWLGEVPSHWTLTPLARLSLERCDGPFGSGIKSEHYTDDGALVIRLQNIRAGLFNIGEPVFIDERYFLKELRGHEVRDGDLLVAGLGDDNNLLGRACIAPAGLGLALVKADCFRFRLDTERAEPEFVAWQLSSGAAYDAGVLATGTTRSRIPLSVMSSRQVALPPKDEQAVIAAFIFEENSKLDTLKMETQRAITLLKERRSGLISAAVTGQIDVRNAVPEATTA